ncbi:hypothetical protein [Shimia sp.]|uniref:hypothetical protein n=1 Tax=Shimia sp. TaxID=1954381 RepID=UPI00329900F0
MSQLTLTKTRLFEGTWEGALRYDDGSGPEPVLDVTYEERAVANVTVTPHTDSDAWVLRVPIPAESLNDGVQTILITDRSSGVRLDTITFISGEALADDIRAEIDLLRAELDMLKRAFRRHCVETM